MSRNFDVKKLITAWSTHLHKLTITSQIKTPLNFVDPQCLLSLKGRNCAISWIKLVQSITSQPILLGFIMKLWLKYSQAIYCKVAVPHWSSRLPEATIQGPNITFQYYVSNYLSQYVSFLAECKDKPIPLQAWTGPEGSRRLRLPDFKTIGTWKGLGCQP